ncbi:MAG: DUF1549 domain-containing protein, partial [Phycisphaeraceae bacterium]
MIRRCYSSTFAAIITLAALVLAPRPSLAAEVPALAEAVSYYRDVRPIFQANCQGCHQPAKAKGKYVMTSFDTLLKGGSSDDAAITPGQPDKSNLVAMITPIKGKAEMPADRKPLHDAEIQLIRKWIAAGATDDTPANAKQRFDMDHPPIYTRPPVITSMDFSPKGDLLAIAGFHEVLLMSADGKERIARLVGMSERIESVRFSPDGSKLAVTGGLPSRMGEVQVWDVAKKKLDLSVPVTYDTVYGASWSPDGTTIAFGCADNTVRAIDAKTGEQTFFNGAHNDWVLDTVFSVDGKQIVSVGRDMASKQHDFATSRFIDNITSITPGALKGGIQAVARHPSRDEIVIGGSDGIVKVYRMNRLTKRVIGDDANLIRQMPAMTGRVFGVAVSSDGKRIAAVSSLDGKAQVHVYSYEFDTGLPDNIKAINGKVVTQRNAAENKALEDFHRKDVKLIAEAKIDDAALYAIAFAPGGQAVAVSGNDGVIRLLDATSGSQVTRFSPAPLAEKSPALVAAKHAPDFIADINPILSRLGCNAGTCHGSLNGKNGFKLSLRGYDAIYDIRSFTDDHASRRVNLASPDDSLMLLKATGAVPHQGGQLFKQDDSNYTLIRDWIAAGAKLDLTVPRVASIDIEPKNPRLADAGLKQAFKVTATFADGKKRDVTALAFIETGNMEVAKAEGNTLTSLRRGEAPILARYEGAYVATILTVMGDRTGFTWKTPDSWGKIDDLVAAKWQTMKIAPSDLCTDEEFLRRVHLDLTGLPPTPEDVRAFLADTRATRAKRDALIDKLVGSEAFIEHWTNKWADLLQVNGKFLGGAGAAAFRNWIRNEVASNTPYDAFAAKVLSASGSNKEHPAASYYKILREPDAIMENTTQLFLGVRFNCNKCHDHPFERWTQDQYYETAAFFARVGLKADPAGGAGKIGGSAVEGAKPLYEIIYELDKGEVIHDRTKLPTEPEFPFDCKHETKVDMTRRGQLVSWMTSPDNPYFARSYVNRLWGYLFGIGIIEPLDDIRAGNPPTNPPLMDYITQQFVESKFDTRSIVKVICKSRTYQLSFRSNKWNEDDKVNFSHRIPKRLPAEVLYDAIYRVTGSTSKFQGAPAGVRAAALTDPSMKAPGGFLETFGRPARESSCECERQNEMHLGSVMAMISGPAVADAIDDPKNAIAALVVATKDNKALVNELFMRVLGREASEKEEATALREMTSIEKDHALVLAALSTKETALAPSITAAEAVRQKEIAAAKTDLDAYQKQLAPKLVQMEAARQAKIKELEAALKAAETGLPQRLEAWASKQDRGADWVILDPKTMKASNNAKLTKEKDGSIFVTGAGGKVSYEIVAETDLANITGIRLEALTDDRLPGKGPGRSAKGNFVVSEFELQVAPKARPNPFAKAAFASALADFSQANYDVKSAIDGKAPDQANGWATSPKVGENRTALFELKDAIAQAGGG